MVKASDLLKTTLVIAVVLALLAGTTLAIDEITNFSGVHIAGTFGTATPSFLVNQQGLGVIAEFQDAGTPVVAINDGGGVSFTGGMTNNSNLVINAPTAIASATPALYINNLGVSDQVAIADGGVVAFQMFNGGGAKFTAPTAIATAVPGLVVDSLGVSNPFEVRDAATPVFAVNNGGTWSSTGAGTHSSGQTVNNWVVVSAPTAIATATPALYVNSAGVSELLVVADAGTPVVDVYNGGGVVIAAPTAIATAIPALVVDSLGVSNILEVRDAATPVVSVANGGALSVVSTTDLQGNVSDSAGTFTIADDVLIDGAADVVQLTVQGNSTQNAGLLVLEASNGTDVLTVSAAGALMVASTSDLQGDIADSGGNLTVADSLDVTGALDVQGGDITLQNDETISNSSNGIISLTATTISAAGNLETTGALDVQGGTITLQNDETINNTVNGTVEVTADIILATGDLQVTNGAEIAGGWPAAAGSADVLDITETAAIQDGTDVLEGIDINLTGADNTGVGNDLTGINLSMTTADVQGRERAIVADDADWEMAMDAGANPIVSSSQRFMEDAFGAVINGALVLLQGSDGGAVDPAIAQAQYGVIVLDGGDSGASVAADTSELALGRHWQANQGGLVFEARLHTNTDIVDMRMCAGLTDTILLEQPATIAGSDVVTTVADDFVAFCFDTAGDTDVWFALSADSTAAGTGAGATAVAPTAAVYQVLRIEIDASGAQARFYIDGVLVKTITAGAVSPDVALGPFVTCQSLAANTQTCDLDYFMVDSKR